jgi:hypothetical protein
VSKQAKKEEKKSIKFMIHIVCVLYGDGTCIPNENCFFSHLLLSEQLNVLINSQGVSAYVEYWNEK